MHTMWLHVCAAHCCVVAGREFVRAVRRGDLAVATG